jgi:hypothetical protein
MARGYSPVAADGRLLVGRSVVGRVVGRQLSDEPRVTVIVLLVPPRV